MANKRIDQLTASTGASNTELCYIGDPSTGALKKITVSLLSPQNLEVALVDGATITWDFSQGNIANVTLGADRTLAITNAPTKSFGVLRVTQDVSGNRTLTLPSGSLTPAGYSLSTTGNTSDVLGFYYDGTNYWWSIDKGYSLPTTTTTTSTTSSTTTSTTTAALNILTWNTIGADMESYNSSQGMRKKSTGATGWDSPTLAACSSLANQTLSLGESVTVKISSSPGLATAIIVSSSTTPNEGGISGIDFAIYSGFGLTSNAQPQEANASLGSTTAISAGDLLRMTYQVSNVLFEKSTNGGGSWTTVATSAGAPTGSYNIVVQSFSPLGGFDQIYK
jgi:hypothetical protein